MVTEACEVISIWCWPFHLWKNHRCKIHGEDRIFKWKQLYIFMVTEACEVIFIWRWPFHLWKNNRCRIHGEDRISIYVIIFYVHCQCGVMLIFTVHLKCWWGNIYHILLFVFLKLKFIDSTNGSCSIYNRCCYDVVFTVNLDTMVKSCSGARRGFFISELTLNAHHLTNVISASVAKAKETRRVFWNFDRGMIVSSSMYVHLLQRCKWPIWTGCNGCNCKKNSLLLHLQSYLDSCRDKGNRIFSKTHFDNKRLKNKFIESFRYTIDLNLENIL